MPRNSWRAASFTLPALLLILFFLVLPLLLLFRYSLNRFVPGQFMVDALTFSNYGQALTDPYYRKVVEQTIGMAVAVTVICLLIGMPVAHYMARSVSRFKSLLLLVVIIPLFVGNAVRSAGWMIAFGREGLVNKLAVGLGILSSPVDIMYTPLAVLLGLISVNMPFVVLTIQSVLEGIERSPAEAAMSLGARPFETWRLVTLPLAMPGVIAAGMMSFILAMNAYATPMLLGGPNFRTMGPVIADQILVTNNWPFGGTLALILIAITTLLTLAIHMLVHRRNTR